MSDETDLGNLWGADAIGRTIGKTAKSTYHMLEAGRLPAKKIGGQWVFSQGEIHHWLEERIGAGDIADLQHVQGLLDQAAAGHEPAEVKISELLKPEAIAIPLAARTRNSVIHSMVELVDVSITVALLLTLLAT